VKVGDLVRDKYMESLGAGIVINSPKRHVSWNDAFACEAYWGVIKEVRLRRASWLEVISESR
jgi:hypothetical protein